MSEQAVVPQEIQDAYYPDGITGHTMIPGGEINLTFLVTGHSGAKTILQRLSHIYNPTVGEDYEVVANHLSHRGWEMAAPIEAADGRTYLYDDSGQLWRGFDYIESKPGSDMEGDLEAGTALGALLGELHRSLSDLDYQPKFAQVNTRGVAGKAKRLAQLLPQITDTEDRELAADMLALSDKESISHSPLQVIHADPRIGNSLFRDGKPFTFIDWDGYKRANPIVDVGDFLQSTGGEVLTKGSGDCSVEQLYPLLEAYYGTAGVGIGKESFMKQALAAARVVALDLGIRHLIDSVEDNYFIWDSRYFDSRFEFNQRCARRQGQVYDILSQ